jgi:DNA polymerase delta subunit 3
MDTIASAPIGSPTEGNTSGQSTPQSSAGVSVLKRSDSKSAIRKSQTAGALFKSFAKAKPKAKDAEKSQDSTSAPPDDGTYPRTHVPRTLTFQEPMQGMSEDEDDGEDGPEAVVDEAKNEAARKAREERLEKLRRMMDDDGNSRRPLAQTVV